MFSIKPFKHLTVLTKAFHTKKMSLYEIARKQDIKGRITERGKDDKRKGQHGVQMLERLLEICTTINPGGFKKIQVTSFGISKKCKQSSNAEIQSASLPSFHSPLKFVGTKIRRNYAGQKMSR